MPQGIEWLDPNVKLHNEKCEDNLAIDKINYLLFLVGLLMYAALTVHLTGAKKTHDISRPLETSDSAMDKLHPISMTNSKEQFLKDSRTRIGPGMKRRENLLEDAFSMPTELQ